MEADTNNLQQNEAILECCLGFKLKPQALTITNWKSLVQSKSAGTGIPSFQSAPTVDVCMEDLALPLVCDPIVYTSTGLKRKIKAADIDYPSVAWLTDGRFKYTTGAFSCYAGLAVVEIGGRTYPKLFHFLKSQPQANIEGMLGGKVVGGYFGSSSFYDDQDPGSKRYLNLGMTPLPSLKEITSMSGFNIMADLENQQIYYTYSDLW